METRKLTPGVYILPGAVNMGLVETGDGLVAVDTGLDKQAAKRLLKAAEEIGQPLVCVINTHAHADHFGGNAHLLSRLENVQFFAPVGEAPVIRRPRFEPEYLWHGAAPVPGLQNKFVLAEPSPVHQEFGPNDAWEIGGVRFQSLSFPGHAHGQCGILVGDVLFAADAYFGQMVTDKHGLPFMVNFEETLQSAKRVGEVQASWFVPGHGDAVDDARPEVMYLCERHEHALQSTRQHLHDGPTLDILTARMCQSFHLEPQNVGSWSLIRTTVSAYVTALVEEGTAVLRMDEGYLKICEQV